MRPFAFTAPRTLDEAIQIMAETKGEARPLAGGSDLIDQLRSGRRRASLVVDIKGVPDMQRLEYIEGDGLHVGAGVPCTATAMYPPVGEHYPSIKEACLLIGSIQIQNRASMGGNVCNASPSADTVPALIIYGAKALIAGPRGQRDVPLEEFFVGPGRSVLQPDELLVELLIPPPPPNSAGHYLRFIPRAEMDIAIAGSGSMVAINPRTRRCTRARIALAAVAPTPVRAKEAEAALEGQTLTDALIHKAAALTPKATSPISDVRGSAEYRKELCQVLTYRTLRQCLTDLGL